MKRLADMAAGFHFSADTWYTIHFWLAVFWIGPMSAVCWVIAFKLQSEVAAYAILLVSNYANFVSHWSAWQAVRAEQGTLRK